MFYSFFFIVVFCFFFAWHKWYVAWEVSDYFDCLFPHFHFIYFLWFDFILLVFRNKFYCLTVNFSIEMSVDLFFFHCSIQFNYISRFSELKKKKYISNNSFLCDMSVSFLIMTSRQNSIALQLRSISVIILFLYCRISSTFDKFIQIWNEVDIFRSLQFDTEWQQAWSTL